MRISDIIPHIDLDRMTTRTFLKLHDEIRRSSPAHGELNPSATRAAMYGNELDDLAVKQARLDLEKTRAEIKRLKAQAEKERSEAMAGPVTD